MQVEYDGVYVAGLRYRMPAVLDFLEDYDEFGSPPIRLEAEPENPFDENAVKVIAEPGRHIGYLPAPLAESIAYRGLSDLRAELVKADIDGLLRVEVEIRVVAGE